MVDRISVPPEIEDEFVAMAIAWRNESKYMSNGNETVQLATFYAIMDKARVRPYLYIPLILKYYSVEHYNHSRSDNDSIGHAWGWPLALSMLLGEAPDDISPYAKGQLDAVVTAYHKLAARKGYLPAQ